MGRARTNINAADGFAAVFGTRRGSDRPDDPPVTAEAVGGIPEGGLGCIARATQDGDYVINFEDFATNVIQDGDVALVIAEEMLRQTKPYEYNEDDPQFYERFTVVNSNDLRAQMLDYEQLTV